MTFTPIGLKSRREALGLSQNWVAEALGTTQITVARWESGERAPRYPDTVAVLLERLEVAMLELEDKIYEDGKTQGSPALIVVFRTDEQFWSVDSTAADSKLPASFYRIAAARAALALRDELDIEARIETV